MARFNSRVENLNPDEFVRRARECVPALRQSAEAAEVDRRISTETMEVLRGAELFRVLQPVRYGGLELDLGTFVRIVEEISRGCGSAGWVYSVVAMHQWHIGLFPVEAQDEVWKADLTALASSSYAPSGKAVTSEGGFRLSGTWSFASGCDNTQWTIMGGRIQADGGSAQPEQCFFLVPRTDYQIEDNWHVLGLSGTGSKNLVVEDAFVPSHRVLTVAQVGSGSPPGAAVNPGSLFRIPFLAAISTCLCTPVIGMAQAALEHYAEALGVRITRGAFTGARSKVAEFQSIQLRVAEAAASIDAARLLILRGCDDTMAAVRAGEELTADIRMRTRRDHAFAVRLLVRATDGLYESTGAPGLFRDNDLQRAWRNVRAGAMHITNNWDAAGTLYGRYRLGLETSAPH